MASLACQSSIGCPEEEVSNKYFRWFHLQMTDVIEKYSLVIRDKPCQNIVITLGANSG